MEKACELGACPDCGSKDIVCTKKEQLLCRKCGLIFEKLAPKEEEKFEKSHNIK